MKAEQSMTAYEHFMKSKGTDTPYGELVALKEAGWIEQCPNEAFWSFRHPDYPGALVKWVVSTDTVTVNFTFNKSITQVLDTLGIDCTHIRR